MHYASVTGLVRMILIILMVYYGIKIVMRLLSPFLMNFVAKKAEKHFGEQFKQFYKQQAPNQSKDKDAVIVDKRPSSKSTNKDVGEYIDYEEID